MRLRAGLPLWAALAGLAVTAAPAAAAPRFHLKRVHSLDAASQPLYLAAPAGSRRIWVVQRDGRVVVLDHGRLRTFLDIRSSVETGGGEQGMFSIAFSPGFARDHRFYVYYSERGTGDEMIVRYLAHGNRAVRSSRHVMLRIRHRDAGNHNGGQLAFGPDGQLWLGSGDGGGANDQFHNSQTPGSNLGKLLEINQSTGKVTQRGRGLRNPWRFSFAPDGTIWIGDVGQDTWEEIDHVNPSAHPLYNFGWPRFEGRALHNSSVSLTGGTYVGPIAVVEHPGSEAIIGGFVYRGPVRALRGWYLYSDNEVPYLRGIKLRRGKRTLHFTITGIPGGATSFGEDGKHRLYLLTYNGIYRFTK
jgi:glucose/arabinose dehydrogenase